MGGESIKPIRKRIHVYFLMTAYLRFIFKYKILKSNAYEDYKPWILSPQK